MGIFAFDLQGRTAYVYSLAVLFVLFRVRAPVGRARRSGGRFAPSVTIRSARRRSAFRSIAAWSPSTRWPRSYAGIAGALLAQTSQFVSLDVLSFERSADVLLMLVIGGTGYLYGGIVGALLFKLAQDALSGLTPQYWHFWIGLLLVVLVLIGRERIHRQIERLWVRASAIETGKI